MDKPKMVRSQEQMDGRRKFDIASPDVRYIADEHLYMFVEEHDNNKRWLNQNGFTHRDDGPAYEHYRGTKSWWQNGKIHRIDGPATIFEDGRMEWTIYGIDYTFDEWCKELNLSIEQKTFIKLKYM